MRYVIAFCLSFLTVYGLLSIGQAQEGRTVAEPSRVATVAPAHPVTPMVDGGKSPGLCRTFVGRITIVQCVPLYSPTGGKLSGPVHEDGSARYSDGWTIDSESRTFYRN